jgi:hypothetical protein
VPRVYKINQMYLLVLLGILYMQSQNESVTTQRQGRVALGITSSNSNLA